jgi:multidrug efflux pump subunit AcrA (membrane-fusion protein)
MATTREERRASPRLALSVPLTVERTDERGGAQGSAETTVTRDISAGGVYFATINGEAFRPGMRVTVKISMPHRSVPGHDRVSFNLVGKGTVIRIDSEVKRGGASAAAGEGMAGVAVRFDRALSFENFQLI